MPVPVSVTVKVRRWGERARVIVVAEASREFWRREVMAEGRVVWVSEVWRRESVLAGRGRMVGVVVDMALGSACGGDASVEGEARVGVGLGHSVRRHRGSHGE